MRNHRQPRIVQARTRARVWLGKWVDLGLFGSPEVKAAYARAVEEWRRSGCPTNVRAEYTVLGLATDWLDAVELEVSPAAMADLRRSLRSFCRLYGDRPARAIRPAWVEDWLRAEAAEGHARTYLVKRARAVRTMIRWAARREYVPADVWHLLTTLGPIRRGQYGARETPRVLPVPRSTVEATLPHLPEAVAAMVRVQLATGMRPGEVCAMRWEEIDRSGDVWVYRPAAHKTAHHGVERAIPLGPRARAVLCDGEHGEHGEPPRAGPVFSPQQNAIRPALRFGGRPNQARDRARAVKRLNGFRGARDPGEVYTVAAYRRAITRACQAAGVTPWHPNQLRHTRATEIRATAGLDAAAAVLGHTRVETTQVYAEVATARAVEVARASG